MYEELITALRTCVDKEKGCDECPYYGKCMTTVGKHAAMVDAADAIEELLQKEKFHAFLWNVINPNDMKLYLEMYHSGNEKEDAG